MSYLNFGCKLFYRPLSYSGTFLHSSRSAHKALHFEQVDLEYLHGVYSGIAVLRLKRPTVRNAINFPMLYEIKKAMEELKFSNNTNVVIVSSHEPGMFCAGADLKERITLSDVDYWRWSLTIRSVFTEISNLPQPVYAAIDGAALGGGAELALACDVRVAASNAIIGFPETKLGIIPGAGGSQRLPRLVGSSIAKELLFTGKVVNAEEASRIDLLNKTVAEKKDAMAAYEEVLQLSMQLLKLGPKALQMAKKAVGKGIEVDIETGLSLEESSYARLISTKDRMEGILAFNEKREPKYTGN